MYHFKPTNFFHITDIVQVRALCLIQGVLTRQILIEVLSNSLISGFFSCVEEIQNCGPVYMRDKLKVALILLIIFLIWISPLLVVWLVTHLVFLYVFQAPERVSYYLSFMVAFVVTAFQKRLRF